MIGPAGGVPVGTAVSPPLVAGDGAIDVCVGGASDWLGIEVGQAVGPALGAAVVGGISCDVAGEGVGPALGSAVVGAVSGDVAGEG